jgi:hypothetical protein
MTELKNCPFCGGEASIVGTDYRGGMYYACCGNVNCFCCVGEGYDRDAMPDHAFVTEELAAEAWNSRTPDLEKVTALLKQIATKKGNSQEEYDYWGMGYQAGWNQASALGQEAISILEGKEK